MNFSSHFCFVFIRLANRRVLALFDPLLTFQRFKRVRSGYLMLAGKFMSNLEWTSKRGRRFWLASRSKRKFRKNGIWPKCLRLLLQNPERPNGTHQRKGFNLENNYIVQAVSLLFFKSLWSLIVLLDRLRKNKVVLLESFVANLSC